EAVGNAVRYAKLYRYLPKPWQSEDLKLTVIEAIHSYLQDRKLEEQNLKLKAMNLELERLTREQAAIIAERTAALEKANQDLHCLAITDSLTQVANRRRFNEYFAEEWQRMAREKQPLSLIMCDVDFFKGYNDRYGHLSGDNCLLEIARAISNAVKVSEHLVARYGGEEFVVVLSNINLEKTVEVAETIREQIKELKIANCQSRISKYVTISLGVSSWVPTEKLSPELMIKEADTALYEAKNLGRDRVIFKTFAPSLNLINTQL
ncbi:MAG: GGDEF domain-containing protein, partial [Okeania sp. SIO2H7]|nr:GGDEF domain-containing protein [Okeania sp. SIO2H7]